MCMCNISTGCYVLSKCGRDRGRVFIVAGAEGQFVYIVDGKLRKIQKPKKKKLKHVIPVEGNYTGGEPLTNKKAAAALKLYQNMNIIKE